MSLLDFVLNDPMARCNGDEQLLSEKEQLAYSIQSHLKLLLNSRQGSLAHMQDYGLPDIPELYRGLPYSTQGLLRSVKETIEKFEPRLTNVRVERMETAEEGCVLRLEILGFIHNKENLRFDTHFLCNGSAKILLEEAR